MVAFEHYSKWFEAKALKAHEVPKATNFLKNK
jgi:hypothetical protein